MVNLKSAAGQIKLGGAALSLCIARTLLERDPSLKEPLRSNLQDMWNLFDGRGDHEAAEMLGMVSRALSDPTFFPPEG
jgi:hypothetical protein